MCLSWQTVVTVSWYLCTFVHVSHDCFLVHRTCSRPSSSAWVWWRRKDLRRNPKELIFLPLRRMTNPPVKTGTYEVRGERQGGLGRCTDKQTGFFLLWCRRRRGAKCTMRISNIWVLCIHCFVPSREKCKLVKEGTIKSISLPCCFMSWPILVLATHEPYGLKKDDDVFKDYGGASTWNRTCVCAHLLLWQTSLGNRFEAGKDGHNNWAYDPDCVLNCKVCS